MEGHLCVGFASSHEGSASPDKGLKGVNAWGPQLSNAKTAQPPSNAASAWSANKGICSYLDCCSLVLYITKMVSSVQPWLL